MKARLLAAACGLLCASASLPLSACVIGECAADPVPPKNIAVVAGDSSVTISWELAEPTGRPLDAVWSQVQYAEAGGPGAECTRHSPREGCVVGCPASAATSCVIRGLTPGTAYTFTVLTQAFPTTLDCSVADAHARSEPATPGAN